MAKSKYLLALLLALVAGAVLGQNFPSRPLTLICPFPPDSVPGQHLQTFAQISTKYLGQPVKVESKPDWRSGFPPADMAASAAPDGYNLALLSISAFRIPHRRRVSWDPTKDFSYVIGIGRFTFGIVVKADSPFKSLQDLIHYAKENPGKLVYGTNFRGSSSHLIMEELGLKTGARLLSAPNTKFVELANALLDGRTLAISETTLWGPQVDAGTFRLIATFGELRSRWNAPTAREQGFDVLSYSPFGIVGPKGMDRKVVKILHDAFNRTLDDPDYDKLMKRLDLVDWYKSSEDYADWAVDQFKFQRNLIERTIGLGNN